MNISEQVSNLLKNVYKAGAINKMGNPPEI